MAITSCKVGLGRPDPHVAHEAAIERAIGMFIDYPEWYEIPQCTRDRIWGALRWLVDKCHGIEVPAPVGAHMKLWRSLAGMDFAANNRSSDSKAVAELRAALRSRSWRSILRAVAADKYSRIVDRTTEAYPQDGYRLERRGISLAVYK